MLNGFRKALISNPLLYIIAGVLTAIAVARTYVLAGGTVDLYYAGILVHHFFIGIILVVVVGIATFVLYDEQLRNKAVKHTLAFLFGFGTGLIVDESNFFISAGQAYSLAQYYDVYNLLFESIIIIVLLALLFGNMYIRYLEGARKKK